MLKWTPLFVMHIRADFNFFLLSFFFSSLCAWTKLFICYYYFKGKPSINSIYNSILSPYRAQNEMQWIVNAAHVKNATHLAKLAKSLMRVALPQKGTAVSNQWAQSTVFGFSPCSESGDKPPRWCPTWWSREGVWGCLVGERAKLGRVQAVGLLRWSFKAISHQPQRRHLETSSLLPGDGTRNPGRHSFCSGYLWLTHGPGDSKDYSSNALE